MFEIGCNCCAFVNMSSSEEETRVAYMLKVLQKKDVSLVPLEKFPNILGIRHMRLGLIANTNGTSVLRTLLQRIGVG